MQGVCKHKRGKEGLKRRGVATHTSIWSRHWMSSSTDAVPWFTPCSMASARVATRSCVWARVGQGREYGIRKR